jgi:ankyrin repeat protein
VSVNRRTIAFASLLVVFLISAISFAATTDELIRAVREGNIAVARALLKQRVDVNAPQGDGATALHWAVQLDDPNTVEFLLRAGARPNAANDTGVTPLYLACMNRNAEMVDKLLAAGANPNAALLKGETVLMMCARSGATAAVRSLAIRGADVNAKEPLHGQTALMWAAAQRRPDVVKILVEAGANIYARSRSFPQIVTAEETQRAGREELNYTVFRGGSTALLFAARVGDVESARLLLAAGANVNDALPDGAPALTVAAHSGQGATAMLLLEKGANPNAAAIGYAALHAAVLRGNHDLVKDLLKHGANPNALMTRGTPSRRANGHSFELLSPLNGATPYAMAAQYLEGGIMRTLAAGGADTRLAKADGTTPLMLAVGTLSSLSVDRRSHRVLDGAKVEDENDVLPVVVAAIELGSDINATNSQGETALHSAATQGFSRVVLLLAEKGADLNIRNKRGQTPLTAAIAAAAVRAGPGDAAAEKSFQATINQLRKLGATE